MQAKFPNKLFGAAVAAGLLLSAPAVALADSGKDDDKKSYDPKVVTVCKKIAFFNKIHFKTRYPAYGHPQNAHFDIIVKNELNKALDIYDTLRKAGYEYPQAFEILDVSVTAVCVVHKDVPQGHRYNDNDY